MPPKDSSSTSSNSSNQRSRHPTSYTLYVEHLGTLVPILEAQKRSSKIRQSFTISLPDSESVTTAAPQPQKMVLDTSETEAVTETNETSVTTNASQLRLSGHEAHLSLNTESGVQLACREDDSESPRHPQSGVSVQQTSDTPQKATAMPENSRHLAEVTSNVMASKFKIQSLSDKLPSDMGSILIKTSFLHIQPRKVITYLPHPELTDSGIDTDSSSDESSSEDTPPGSMASACSAEVFIEPDVESRSIEGLMSMEELLLPKATQLESKPLRAVSTTVGDRSLRASSHIASGTALYNCMSPNVKGQRMSMSDSHIQIHSKTPTWNEQHMIYQLDFGGRVTTKSAKNFQLELENEQVRTQEMA